VIELSRKGLQRLKVIENAVAQAAALLQLSRRQVVERHGVPLSLYRDRHSTFQRNDAHWSLEEELAGRQRHFHRLLG